MEFLEITWRGSQSNYVYDQWGKISYVNIVFVLVLCVGPAAVFCHASTMPQISFYVIFFFWSM